MTDRRRPVNVSEAKAINRLIRAALLGTDDSDERQLRDDAAFLADRAHRTLGAGLDGAQVRKAWPLPGDPDDRPAADVPLP